LPDCIGFTGKLPIYEGLLIAAAVSTRGGAAVCNDQNECSFS